MIAPLLLAVALGPPPSFVTGLRDLFAYAGPQAAVEFERGERDDPAFVLNYWGDALALGTDLNTGLTSERFAAAHAAIVKAAPYLPGASARDKALVHAVELRYAGDYSQRNRDADAYRAAMEAYVSNDPADDDATMLLVEDLMERHGMTWNADGTPKDDTSREILALTKTVLIRAPDHLFANHLCIHEYDNAPDRTFAIACARRLDAMTFVEPEEHLAHMPAHLWNELGDGKRSIVSSERAWALHPTRYAQHDAYVGLAGALMCGDARAIETWRVRLAQTQDDPVNLALPPYAVNAQRMERAGNVDGALRVLESTAAVQSHLGELVPFYPANVRVGALLVRAGRYAQARDAFAAILAEHPRLPRALFGMATSLDALGDAAGAAQYRAEFARYWAGDALTIQDF